MLHCLECDRPIMPGKLLSAERPAGVFRHAGHGLCDQCYQAAKRLGYLEYAKAHYATIVADRKAAKRLARLQVLAEAEKMPSRSPYAPCDERLAEVAPGLLAYLQRRRALGVPVTGLPYEADRARRVRNPVAV